MIKVVNAESTDTRQYVYPHSFTGNSSSCLNRFYVCAGTLDSVKESAISLNTDFLHQGAPFDKFNNKSVEFRQVEGTLQPFTSAAEYGSRMSVRGSCTYSFPLKAYIGGIPQPTRMYAFLPLGDAIVYGFNSKRYCGAEMFRNIIADENHVGMIQGTGYVNSAKNWVSYSVTAYAKNTTQVITRYVEPYEKGTDVYNFGFATKIYSSLSLLMDSAEGSARAAVAGAPVASLQRVILSESSVKPEIIESMIDMADEISASMAFAPDELSIHARNVIESYNDFDSNMIAYVSDLKSVGDTLRSVLKLSRNPGSLAEWASAWLSGRYGDRLFVSDTVDLMKSLNKRLTTRTAYTKARARMTKELTTKSYFATRTRKSTLYAANESYNDLMTAVGNLMRWDAWPTLENTWDMVPLSFVVDWVLPVSDILKQIDAAVEAPYIRPISSYVSEKSVVEFAPLSDTSIRDLKVTSGFRRPHNVVADVRPFDVNISFPSFSVLHTVDAAALVVQLRRRA